MHAHSPQHLSEWAELIGAELPDEYAECEYKHGCEHDYERKREREHEHERERERKRKQGDSQAQAEGDSPTVRNCSRRGH